MTTQTTINGITYNIGTETNLGTSKDGIPVVTVELTSDNKEFISMRGKKGEILEPTIEVL